MGGASDEPKLKKAMDTLEFLSQDAAARMECEARMKALSDEKSRIEGARAEGLAAGKSETARNLLALGADVPFIMKATGLSEKEIEALRPIQ